MSKDKWLSAAKKFNEKRLAEEGEPKPYIIPELDPQALKEISAAAAIEKALEDFSHGDEWRPAYELLRASKRHVVIAEENEGGGMQLVYHLNQHGYMETVEPTGTRLLYGDEATGNKSQTKMASKRMIAHLIVRQSKGNATADQVLEVIRKGLNAIAAEIDN